MLVNGDTMTNKDLEYEYDYFKAETGSWLPLSMQIDLSEGRECEHCRIRLESCGGYIP